MFILFRSKCIIILYLQELQRVENLNIRTVHSGLVQERIVGSWTITKCINCNMDTHAVNKQKEGTFGLVSAFLLVNKYFISIITKLKPIQLV